MLPSWSRDENISFSKTLLAYGIAVVAVTTTLLGLAIVPRIGIGKYYLLLFFGLSLFVLVGLLTSAINNFKANITNKIPQSTQLETGNIELIREQAARTLAEVVQWRFAFLAEASTILSSSLDYETTLTNVANLAVPMLADWCVVDIVEEDQSVHRVTVAHTDPAKLEWAKEWQRRNPFDPNDSSGVAEVLRSGRSQICPYITDEMLVAGARSPEHLQDLREGQFKSVMVVPLKTREKPFGAISFVTSDSDRHYGDEDLALAEDLGSRAAMAVENAKLYRQAQKLRVAAEQAANRTVRMQAVTAALSKVLNWDQVAEVVVDQGIAALEACAGSLVMLNDFDNNLEIVKAVGYPQEAIDPWQRFPLESKVPLAESVRTGEAIFIESQEAMNDRYPHLARSISLTSNRAYAAIPLIVEGQPVGTMGLSFDDSRQFSDDDRAFMVSLAQQAALAMERAYLYEAEQTARTEAETANRMKDEFLAIVSHELRTPLNSMLGWATLLRNRKFDQPTIDRALETIERNAKSQKQLIDDLLDVSRIIRGKLRLNVRSVDLAFAIEEAVQSVLPAAQAKSIQLESVLEKNIGLVYGDGNRLQQVMWNLLSNAIKFTPAGGCVKVFLERNNSHAQIQVKDTGKGISADFLPFVFDRFRQANSSSTRRYGGLGLGLSIVRQLVELHGGIVEADSPGIGKGAIFTVLLPICQEATTITEVADHKSKEQSPLQPPILIPQPLDHPSLNGLRVLLVDDEPDNLEFLTRALAEYEAKVTAVTSVQEALVAFEEWHPDVLVSDISMPEEDGYELINYLHEKQADSSEKILMIALTAYARQEDREQALLAGFDGYLSKPVDPYELVQAIVRLGK